jgi:hypothetical protein
MLLWIILEQRLSISFLALTQDCEKRQKALSCLSVRPRGTTRLLPKDKGKGKVDVASFLYADRVRKDMMTCLSSAGINLKW